MKGKNKNRLVNDIFYIPEGNIWQFKKVIQIILFTVKTYTSLYEVIRYIKVRIKYKVNTPKKIIEFIIADNMTGIFFSSC